MKICWSVRLILMRQSEVNISSGGQINSNTGIKNNPPKLCTPTEANPFLYWYMSTNSTYQHVHATAEVNPWCYFQETYSKNVYHRYLELSSNDARHLWSPVILHVLLQMAHFLSVLLWGSTCNLNKEITVWIREMREMLFFFFFNRMSSLSKYYFYLLFHQNITGSSLSLPSATEHNIVHVLNNTKSHLTWWLWQKKLLSYSLLSLDFPSFSLREA